MEKIVVYSSGCPRCNTLKKKLDIKGVKYEVFDDVDKMIEMGLTEVPILEVDGTKMSFSEAVKWIGGR